MASVQQETQWQLQKSHDTRFIIRSIENKLMINLQSQSNSCLMSVLKRINMTILIIQPSYCTVYSLHNKKINFSSNQKFKWLSPILALHSRYELFALRSWEINALFSKNSNLQTLAHHGPNLAHEDASVCPWDSSLKKFLTYASAENVTFMFIPYKEQVCKLILSIDLIHPCTYTKNGLMGLGYGAESVTCVVADPKYWLSLWLTTQTVWTS